VDVISSETLRQDAAAGPARLVIDHHGGPVEIDGLAHDTPIPALVVSNVTEAVKQVGEGMVVSYLNRDALWAVDCFLLDRAVVASLPDRVESPVGLIEAVREAGFEWHAVLPKPPEPPS
jgi:hypothetical protein